MPDTRTIQAYDSSAHERAPLYETARSALIDSLSKYLGSGSSILDIGCGSGKDISLLQGIGHRVTGVEPSREMRNQALAFHPALVGCIFDDSLPELSRIPAGPYDAICCLAVLQHLKREELFVSFLKMRNMLRPGGLIGISVPESGRDVMPDGRDVDGRLFSELPYDFLDLLLQRLGFTIIESTTTADELGRQGIMWLQIIARSGRNDSSLPLDKIEAVLNRDRKTATYKLALMRSLADVAMTSWNSASWIGKNKVQIPLSLIVERWIEYYWPIVSNPDFIPQIRGERRDGGRPLSFRSSLLELTEKYRTTGGLGSYVSIRDSPSESSPQIEAKKRTRLSIERAILRGPVAFLHGFQVCPGPDNHSIILEAELWKEQSQFGHFIRDSIILRWAELSSRIAKGNISPSMVIEVLLASPEAKRDVSEVRDFYSRLDRKECVWTGKKLESRFVVDHALPFSLWSDNSLWNLLPSETMANRQKSDMIPSSRLLSSRRDCIISYWERLRGWMPNRFEHEASLLVGQHLPASDFYGQLFSTFREAAEMTAIQRACDRWEP
jgi:SAM-dependent methyltransferase